ncbi:MAG: hypothetical protein DMG91_15995, partial [Acidobacteria bacterium]
MLGHCQPCRNGTAELCNSIRRIRARQFRIYLGSRRDTRHRLTRRAKCGRAVPIPECLRRRNRNF